MWAGVVCQDEHFVAYCQYVSRFPFEMTICPTRHSQDFVQAGDSLLVSLGEIVQYALERLRIDLKDPPYNSALHTSPNIDVEPCPLGYWERSQRNSTGTPNVMTMVTQVAGLEWGTGVYVNSTQPESAAAFLRDAI